MTQPKKLIEVAMPVKEISVESVRDKSIRHGHISTLHLWWARRPLPVCRAVVFASLVPDPLDENCPQQFLDAVNKLLAGSTYKPYEDIPYTASVDPMDDNPRNRLLMFIGKYSKKFIQIEKSGEGTCAPKETLDNGSLIKWENKNNEGILNIARKLIFVAHNTARCPEDPDSGRDSARTRVAAPARAAATAAAAAASASARTNSASATDSNCSANNNSINNSNNATTVIASAAKQSQQSCDELLAEFDQLYSAIKTAETDLYETPNRHLQTNEVKQKEETLHNAIEAFLDKMPKVFDPFAGGGAIPLEAARLGCRTYANDLNPVAHIIEKASIEFPQKYGKPITYSKDEFIKIYGEEEFHKQEELKNVFGDKVNIQNRLSFDVEYYAKKLLKMTEDEVGHLYPSDENGNKPVAYYWARVGTCSNPSCRAEVPLLRQFYLADTKSKKVYLNPIIHGKKINFEIKTGSCESEGFLNRANLSCPICGNVTNTKELKEQFISGSITHRPLAIIWEGDTKFYTIPTEHESNVLLKVLPRVERSLESMPVENKRNFNTPGWGIDKWADMFSDRQMLTLRSLLENQTKLKSHISELSKDTSSSILTYLAILIDRIAIVNTTFGVWHTKGEKLERPMGRQAVPMTFDYPESNPFCNSSGSAYNQIDWILRYIDEESKNSFSVDVFLPMSSVNLKFDKKELNAVITDPPYYDAIAYAELSDFFYVWLKRSLIDVYPESLSTPVTPKTEECTALKHYYDGNELSAKNAFEIKLKSIFSSIEYQTRDIVSIMFAHQSTEAWTTLCNSILASNMNISGSWANETELTGALKTDKAFLASSVTVSCKPSQKQGVGDSKEVKAAIELKVKNEVEELYKLGFRGADLLTACFGPAVSEFGKYERVEKASGEEVTVEELLTWARDAAFNAIVSDIPTDDFTRFYIGWLNLFGFSETEHDDVRRITQIGLHLDVNDLLANHLLIRNGNKQTLSTFTTRNAENKKLGEARDSYTIDLVHKALHLLKNNNRKSLLAFIGDHAQNQEDIFWRVANSLKEVLPKGMEDQKQVSELLANKDNLIKDSKTVASKLGEQEDMFKQ